MAIAINIPRMMLAVIGLGLWPGETWNEALLLPNVPLRAIIVALTVIPGATSAQVIGFDDTLIQFPAQGHSTLTRAERVALFDWAPELPIKTQAALLSLNRSSLYNKLVGPSEAELALKHRIDEIDTGCPFYGSRRITAQMRREGYTVKRKSVQRKHAGDGHRRHLSGP